jgi:hypothetical protein
LIATDHSVFVVPALVAGIHVLKAAQDQKTWMAGTNQPGHDEVGVTGHFYQMV